MLDVVLCTFNARYIHAAFGLRYLMANLGPLRERACILEFETSQRPVDALEKILAQNPKIVAVGVYIWNANVSAQLVAELKRVRPDICVVLGGPEVSHETELQPMCGLADYVIRGEADLAFAELCQKILNNRRPLQRIIDADLPVFEGERAIELPYALYGMEDVKQRMIYVEASRGCPFSCEFCLSSLEVPVRNVPVEPFLAEMGKLLDRGVRQFKFVDRTFNLNLKISSRILEFFLARWQPGIFLHFEMIPDRLPEALRNLLAKFQPGAMQLEVGIQTFNEDVGARISRRQDNRKVEENLRYLREHTGVHVHADLIVGLPGEDVESFGRGFDRLVALGPQEIQVGMLKRLRGTPIVRHDRDFGMVYSPEPPYEILQTAAIDFSEMQRLRRFSRVWDLIGNSGNFLRTTRMMVERGSAFARFMVLSEGLHRQLGRSHGIALVELARAVFEFLRDLGYPAAEVARAVAEDYHRGGRSDVPAFLRNYVKAPDTRRGRIEARLPRRQARHLQQF